MSQNKPRGIENGDEDLLRVMDILDLDESIIDVKIEKIISQPEISESNLRPMLIFTRYKHMISKQEETDCDNEPLVNYMLRQLIELDTHESKRFATLLEILVYSIQLNKENMIFFVEHTIQQLFASINESHDAQMSEEVVSKNIMYLKIIDSMMLLCIEHGFKPDYKFLDSEVYALLQHKDERLYKEIISTTVPNVIICYEDHNILNVIWDNIMNNIDDIRFTDILTLCTLSDFYFPMNKNYRGYKIDSVIIDNIDLWRLIQAGICSKDSSIRKYTIYIAKRAIDHIVQDLSAVCIETESSDYEQDEDVPLILYNVDMKDMFETAWTNFFIIMESLEEKQFYLVDSALNLLPKISKLHLSWYNCILRRGLMHDTDTVLIRVLKIVFEYNGVIQNVNSFPFKELLNVLNKTSIYDNLFNNKNHVMMLFKNFINLNLEQFIKAMKEFTLSPIPRFFISYLFMMMKDKSGNHDSLKKYINAYIKDTPYNYNNELIEYVTQCCIEKYCISNLLYKPTMDDFLMIFEKFSDVYFTRHHTQWYTIVSKIQIYLDNSRQRAYDDILSLNTKLSHYDIYAMKPIVKLIIAYFVSCDSNMDLFDYIVSKNLEQLKDCNTRTSAPHDKFDSHFFILVNILDAIQVNGIKPDDLNTNFDKCIVGNISGITSYILFRLQNVSPLLDYKLVNKCIEGIESLMNQSGIAESFALELQSITNVSIEMIRKAETSAIQKYFAVKIISVMASSISENDLCGVIEKNYNFSVYVDGLSDILFLKLSSDDCNVADKGNLISSYNHTICKIQFYYYLHKKYWNSETTSKLYEYILDVIEKGGTECLLWPIKLCKILLENFIKENIWDKIHFLLNRIWKEILQVKKNHQFYECMEEFIKMVYDENLLTILKMKLLSLEYSHRLFELGKTTPCAVYLLINHMRTHLRHINLMFYIPIIVKSLMFCTVPRKDQRIEHGICEFIEANESFFRITHLKKHVLNPYEHIKIITLDILIHQKDNFHTDIVIHLQDEIEIMCREKHRYHGNSLNHRILLRCLQTLLLIYITNPNISNAKKNIVWGKQILMKQPHHASIRLILEWYISLHLIYTNKPLEESVDEFQLNDIPQISFFMIIYHVTKHQLLICENEIVSQIDILHHFDGKTEHTEIARVNLIYVMDTYLLFSIGQLFNVRLYAQYLFSQLYALVNIPEIKSKYDIFNTTISINFKMSSEEKNFKRIRSDFYVNKFDIICNLRVRDIYYNIPRLTDVSEDEWIKHRNVLFLDKLIIHLYVKMKDSDFACLDQSKNRKFDLCNVREILRGQSVDDPSVQEASGVIQKKFIPWKNMLIDMELENSTERNKNELVVVASLVDKIPNLGGLSRTCEIFGVGKYVISSLRHLQDKQFQSLSVSSEKWLDIAEIQPGTELKNYLISMKNQGYKIVGAEQTSSSVPLNQFKFPKKMVLLLGNEKEGVPPDLLYMMDYCVEIPQQGVIRSLNVHVTASIFIWEYSSQHK